MLQQLFDERRRHERILCDLPATLQQYDPQGELCLQTEGRILNMSSGGLCAASPHPLLPDLPVWVRLRLGSKPVQIAARQVRRQSLGDALHYAALEFDRRCIEPLVHIAAHVAAVRALIYPEPKLDATAASA
jgi:hypothetical protein